MDTAFREATRRSQRQMPPNNNIIQCTHTFGIGIILYHIEIGTRQIPPNNNITQCTHTHLVVVLVLCHIETGTRQRAPCSWPRTQFPQKTRRDLFSVSPGHIYMYIYIYTHTHTNIYTYIYMYIYIYIYIYI